MFLLVAEGIGLGFFASVCHYLFAFNGKTIRDQNCFNIVSVHYNDAELTGGYRDLPVETIELSHG